MADNRLEPGNGAPKNSLVPGALSTHQRDAVAKMVVFGHGPKTIAEAVRKSPAYISKVTHPDTGDPKILDLITLYESKQLRVQANLKFELMEYVDHAKSAIADGLDPSADIRTRLDTAWRLIKEIQPSTTQVNVNHSGKVSMEANIEVSGSLKAIALHLAEIRAAPGSFQARLKEGDDVLPGPAALPSGDDDLEVLETMEPISFEEVPSDA